MTAAAEKFAPDDLEHCTKHPDAPVRHTFDADFYVMNGEVAGAGMNRRTVMYECSACGSLLRRIGGAA